MMMMIHSHVLSTKARKASCWFIKYWLTWCNFSSLCPIYINNPVAPIQLVWRNTGMENANAKIWSAPPSLVVLCCCLCLDPVVFTVATRPPVISNDQLRCHLLTLSRLFEGPEAIGCQSQHFFSVRLERGAIEDKPTSHDLQVTAERPLTIFCIHFSPAEQWVDRSIKLPMLLHKKMLPEALAPSSLRWPLLGSLHRACHMHQQKKFAALLRSFLLLFSGL